MNTLRVTDERPGGKIARMREIHPDVTWYDPPKGGLNVECPDCGARAWIPVGLIEHVNSYPHKKGCPLDRVAGPLDIDVLSVTGDPLLTVWNDRPGVGR